MARLDNVERAAKARTKARSASARTPYGREATVRKAWAAWIAKAQVDPTNFDAWFLVRQTADDPPDSLLAAARSGAITDMTRQGVARFVLAAFLEAGRAPIRTDPAGHLLHDGSP